MIDKKHERYIVFCWADRDAPAPHDCILNSFSEIEKAILSYDAVDSADCASIFDCDDRSFIASKIGTGIYT